MIKVWADGAETGFLDRDKDRGSSFVYSPQVDEERAVSMTMPVRLTSYETRFGLAPVFEMNLPEGFLRERLRMTFAKATGTFEDIDLLAVVGRPQVGRIRYTGEEEGLEESAPFQAVDDILTGRRDKDLFRYLVENFAGHSGV